MRTTTPAQNRDLIPVTSTQNKSLMLITIGTAQLVVTSILICICIWIVSVNRKFPTNYETLFSCFYHATLSSLLTFSGTNVGRYRCVVGFVMSLALFGLVITPAMLVDNVKSWFDFKVDCENGCVSATKRGALEKNLCAIVCENLDGFHLPSIIGIAIQTIVNVIVCVVSCYNYCSICGYREPRINSRSRRIGLGRAYRNQLVMRNMA